MAPQSLKISIITTSYNSSRTIEQTLQSVISQNYVNIEYIIIDGGSKDETMNIVNKYKERIQTIISEEDKGVYDAFNKGSKLASGDYIFFVNSDDYLHDENVISDMVDFLTRQENPIAVYGDIFIVNEKTGYVCKHGRKFEYTDLKQGLMPPHTSFIIKRLVLEEFGFFNLDYKIRADYNLIFSVYKKYEKFIYYNNRMVAYFREGGLSSQLSTHDKLVEETEQIIAINDCDVSLIGFQKMGIVQYLKKWLECLLFDQKGLSNQLLNKNIQNVAIFGTGELALLMYKDLLNNSIQPVIFLDNNSTRWETNMNGLQISSPDWLSDHSHDVDAVILAFEGNHDEVVTQQIKTLTNNGPLQIISWRELTHTV